MDLIPKVRTRINIANCARVMPSWVEIGGPLFILLRATRCLGCNMIRFVVVCFLLVFAVGCQTTKESPGPNLSTEVAVSEEEIQASRETMFECLSGGFKTFEDGVSDATVVASAVMSVCSKEFSNLLALEFRGQTEFYQQSQFDDAKAQFTDKLVSKMLENRASTSFECFRTKDGLCHTREQFNTLTEQAFGCVERSIPDLDKGVGDADAVALAVFNTCADDFAPIQGKTEDNGVFKDRTLRDISDHVQKLRS